MKFKSQQFKFRALVGAVLSIFLLETLAWSAPFRPAPTTEPAISFQVPISEIIQDPAKLPIPSEFATLKEFHIGTNGKLLIHIQDAHSNYSGQMNMANALEVMMRQTGMDTVFVEGADQEVTLRETKKVTDQKTWGVAANRLLLQGIISGEEYLNLTSDLPLRLMGMEYQDLYDENLITYKDLVQHRDAVTKYMSQIKTRIRSLKERLYSPELLKYEQVQKKDHEENFRESFELLAGIGAKAGVETPDLFPEMKKLKALQVFEQRIDFESANKEQQMILSKLKDLGVTDEVNSFIENSKKSAVTQGSQVSRIAYLFALAESKGLVTERFSALESYREYLNLFSELNIDRLLVEMDWYEDTVYREVLGEENARKVRAIDRYIGLLDRAFEVKLSSDDFRMLSVNRPDFDTQEWQAFLNEMILDLQGFEDLIPFEDYIDTAYPDLNHFYQVVNKRDQAFLENTGRLMKELGVESGFMIAGGYHTANLTKLMREQGYSYLVLTPVVEFETDHSQYEKNLLQGLSLALNRESDKQIAKSVPDQKKSRISTLRKIGFVKLAPQTVNAWSIPSTTLTAARLADAANGSQFHNERADSASDSNFQTVPTAGENLTPEIFGRFSEGQRLILGSRLSSAAMLQNEEMLEVLTRSSNQILQERGLQVSVRQPDAENNGNFDAGTFTLVLKPDLIDGPVTKPYLSVFKLVDNKRVAAQKKQLGETLSDAEIAEDLGGLVIPVDDHTDRISKELIIESIAATRKIGSGSIPENIRTEAGQKEYALYEQPAVITLDEIYDLVIQSDDFQSVQERLEAVGINPVNDWGISPGNWRSDIHTYLISQNLQLFQKALARGRLIVDPKLNNSGIALDPNSSKDVKSLDYSFAPRLTGTPENPTFNDTSNQINPDHPYISMGLILAGIPSIDLNDAKVLETVTPEYVDSLREVYRSQTVLGDWSRLFAGFLKDVDSWRQARAIILDWFKLNNVARAMRIRSVIQQLIDFSNQRIEGPEITPSSLLKSLYQVADQMPDETRTQSPASENPPDTENGARLSPNRSSGENKPLNLVNTNIVFQVNSQNRRELVTRIKGEVLKIDVSTDGKIDSRDTFEFLDGLTLDFHKIPVLYKIAQSKGKRYLAVFVDRGTGSTSQRDLIQALLLDESIPVTGVRKDPPGANNYLVPILSEEDEAAISYLKTQSNPNTWKFEIPKPAAILNTNAFITHSKADGKKSQAILHLRRSNENLQIPLTLNESGRYLLPDRTADGFLLSKSFSQSFGNKVQFRSAENPKIVLKTYEIGNLSVLGNDESVYEPRISRSWIAAAAISVATVLLFVVLWFAILPSTDTGQSRTDKAPPSAVEPTEGIYSEEVFDLSSPSDDLPLVQGVLRSAPDLLTPATGENIGRPSSSGTQTVYMKRLGETSASLISSGVYDGFADGKWQRAKEIHYRHQGELTGQHHQYEMYIGRLRIGQSVNVPLALNESVSDQTVRELSGKGLSYNAETRTLTANRDLFVTQTLVIETDVWSKNTTFENTLTAEAVLKSLELELNTVPEVLTDRLNELLSDNVNTGGVEGVRDVLQLISEFVQYSRDVKLELKSGSMMEHLGRILDENGVIKCDCDVASDVAVKLLRKLGYNAYVVRGFSGSNSRGQVTSDNLHAYVAVEVGGDIHIVDPVEVMQNVEQNRRNSSEARSSIELRDGPKITDKKNEDTEIKKLIEQSFLDPKSPTALPEIAEQRFDYPHISENLFRKLISQEFERSVILARFFLSDRGNLLPDKKEIAKLAFGELQTKLIDLEKEAIDIDMRLESERRKTRISRILNPSFTLSIQRIGEPEIKKDIKTELYGAEDIMNPSAELKKEIVVSTVDRMKALWVEVGWGAGKEGSLTEGQVKLMTVSIENALSNIDPSDIAPNPFDVKRFEVNQFEMEAISDHLIQEASSAVIQEDTRKKRDIELEEFKSRISGSRLSSLTGEDRDYKYQLLREAVLRVLAERMGDQKAKQFSIPESADDNKKMQGGTFSMVIQPKNWTRSVFKLTDEILTDGVRSRFGQELNDFEIQKILGSYTVINSVDLTHKLSLQRSSDGAPVMNYQLIEQPAALSMFRLLNRLQGASEPDKFRELLIKSHVPMDEWRITTDEDWKAGPHAYMQDQQIRLFSDLLARGFFMIDPKEDNIGIKIEKGVRKHFRLMDINMVQRLTGTPANPSFNDKPLVSFKPNDAAILYSLIDYLMPMDWPQSFSPRHLKALQEVYEQRTELGDIARIIAVILADEDLYREVNRQYAQWKTERVKKPQSRIDQAPQKKILSTGQRLEKLLETVNQKVSGDPITVESLTEGLYLPRIIRRSSLQAVSNYMLDIIQTAFGKTKFESKIRLLRSYANQFSKYAMTHDPDSMVVDLLRSYDAGLDNESKLDTIGEKGILQEIYIQSILIGDRSLKTFHDKGARLADESASIIVWDSGEVTGQDFRSEVKKLISDNPDAAESVVVRLENALIEYFTETGVRNFQVIGDIGMKLFQENISDTELNRVNLSKIIADPKTLVDSLKRIALDLNLSNVSFLFEADVLNNDRLIRSITRYIVSLLYGIDSTDGSTYVRGMDSIMNLANYLDALSVRDEGEDPGIEIEFSDDETNSENSLSKVKSTVISTPVDDTFASLRIDVNRLLEQLINLHSDFGTEIAQALDRYQAEIEGKEGSTDVSTATFIKFLRENMSAQDAVNGAYQAMRNQWLEKKYWDFLEETAFSDESERSASEFKSFFSIKKKEYILEQMARYLKDIGISDEDPTLSEVESILASGNISSSAKRFNKGVVNGLRSAYAQKEIGHYSNYRSLEAANRLIVENEDGLSFLSKVLDVVGSRLAAITKRKTPNEIRDIVNQTEGFKGLFSGDDGSLREEYLSDDFKPDSVVASEDRSKIRDAFRSLAAYEAPFKDSVDSILKLNDPEERLKAIQDLEQFYLPVNSETAGEDQIRRYNGLTPKMASALFQLYFNSGLDKGIVHAKMFYENVLRQMEQHLNPENLENYLRLLNLIGQFKPDLIDDNAYDTLFETADQAEQIVSKRNYLKGVKKRVIAGIQIARATAFKNRYRAAYDFARELEIADNISDPIKLATLYYRFRKAYSEYELRELFGSTVFNALPLEIENPNSSQAQRITGDIDAAIRLTEFRMSDPAVVVKNVISRIKESSSKDAATSQAFYRLAYSDESDAYPLGEGYALSNVMRTLIYNGEFEKARQIAPIVVRVSVETDYFNDFWSAASVAEAEIIGMNGSGYRERAMNALEQAIKLSSSSPTELASYLDVIEHLAIQLRDHHEERWERAKVKEATEGDRAYEFLTKTFLPRLREAAEREDAADSVQSGLSELGEILVRTSYKISGSSKFIRPMNLRFGGTVPGAYVGLSDYGLLNDFLTTPAEGLGGKALIEIDDFDEVNEEINGFIKSNFNLKNFELIESEQHLLYDAPTVQSVSFMGSDISKRGATGVVTQTFAGIGDCRYCNFFGQFALMTYVKIKRHQADAKLVRSILADSLSDKEYEVKKGEWLLNDFHHLEVGVVDTYLSAAVQKDGPYSATKVLANGTSVTDIESQKDFYFVPGPEQKIEPHTLLHVIRRDKEKSIQAFSEGTNPLNVFDAVEEAYLNDFFYQRVYPLRGYRFIQDGSVVGGIQTDEIGSTGNLKLNSDGSIDLRIPGALRLLKDPDAETESRTDLNIKIIARSRQEGNRTNLPTTFDVLGTQGFYHHRPLNFPADTVNLLLSHIGDKETPKRRQDKLRHIRIQRALRHLVEGAEVNELYQIETSNLIGDAGSRLAESNSSTNSWRATDEQISRVTDAIISGESLLASDYQVPEALNGTEINGASRLKFLKIIHSRQQGNLQEYERLEREGIVVRAKLYRSGKRKKRDSTSFLFFDIYETENKKLLQSRVQAKSDELGRELSEDEIEELRFLPLTEEELRVRHLLNMQKNEEGEPIEIFVFPHQWRNAYLPIESTVVVNESEKQSTAYWGEVKNTPPAAKVFHGVAYEFKGIGTKEYRNHVAAENFFGDEEGDASVKGLIRESVIRQYRLGENLSEKIESQVKREVEKEFTALTRLRSADEDGSKGASGVVFRGSGGLKIVYTANDNQFSVFKPDLLKELVGEDGIPRAGKFLGLRYQRVSKNYVGGLNSDDERVAIAMQYRLLREGAELGAWIHEAQIVDQNLLGAAYRIRMGSGVRLTSVDQPYGDSAALWDYIVEENNNDKNQVALSWLPKSLSRDGRLVRAILNANLRPHESQGIGKDKDIFLNLYDVDYRFMLSKSERNRPDKSDLVAERRKNLLQIELYFAMRLHYKMTQEIKGKNVFAFLGYAEGLLFGTDHAESVLTEFWQEFKKLNGEERKEYVKNQNLERKIIQRLKQSYSAEQINLIRNISKVLAVNSKENRPVALRDLEYIIREWRKYNSNADKNLDIESIGVSEEESVAASRLANENQSLIDIGSAGLGNGILPATQDSVIQNVENRDTAAPNSPRATQSGPAINQSDVESMQSDSFTDRFNISAFSRTQAFPSDQLFDNIPQGVSTFATKTGLSYALADSEAGSYLFSASRTSAGLNETIRTGGGVQERIIPRTSLDVPFGISTSALRDPVSNILSVGVRLAAEAGINIYNHKRDPEIRRVTRGFNNIKYQNGQRIPLGGLVLNLDGLTPSAMREEVRLTGVIPTEFTDLLSSWKSGISFTETFGGSFFVSVLNPDDEVSQLFLQAAIQAGFNPQITNADVSITYITPHLATEDGFEFDNGEGRTDNVSIFAYRDTEIGAPEGDIIANTNRVLITAAAINYRKSMKLDGQKDGFEKELNRALTEVLYGKDGNINLITDEEQLIERASGPESHIFKRALFEHFLFTFQAAWNQIREQILADEAASWSA